MILPRIYHFFVICTLLSLAGTAHSQTAPAVMSARAMGMGDVGVALDGIDAAYFNPAGLTGLTGWGAQANFSMRFGLSELSQENLTIALPVFGHSTIIGTFRRYGFSAFRQQVMSVGYARKLSTGLSLALQFDAHSFSIEKYGSIVVPGYRVSLWQQVLPELRIGFHTANPVTVNTHEEIELPTQFNLGLAYQPSALVTVYCELEKESTFDPSFKAGVEYRLAPAFTLRLGGSTAPGRIHGGVGYRFTNGLRIDLGGSYHAQLGLTPAIGVSLMHNEDGSDDRILYN